MMFKRILVAIDHSEAAKRALDLAVELAKKYQAELTIITVFEPLQITTKTDPPSGNIAPYLREIKDDHMELLNISVSEVLEKAPDLSIIKMLVYGKASEKIVEACKEGGSDLVVMGSRGSKGIRGFMGSTSRRVLEGTPCPLLIVK